MSVSSAAVHAYGAALKRGDGATPTENFTTIAYVDSIDGVSITRDSIEVTAHDSPDGYREFIPGLKDAGEITTSLFFDPANATHDETTGFLEDLATQGTPGNYELHLATSPAWKFSFCAFVTSFSLASPIDDALKADVTWKLSGKPTFAAA